MIPSLIVCVPTPVTVPIAVMSTFVRASDSAFIVLSNSAGETIASPLRLVGTPPTTGFISTAMLDDRALVAGNLTIDMPGIDVPRRYQSSPAERKLRNSSMSF